MSKKPIQENKSQIAYRQESEAKAASQALRSSKQNTDRENRLLGRDAHSHSSTTVQISEISVKAMENQLKQELEQAQKLISQLKLVEKRYYENIDIDKQFKESKQLEILEAQTRAAEAQTLATQSQLEVLKYANDNPSNSASQMATQAPVAAKVIQWKLPASQPFFSAKSSDSLTIRQWIVATEVNFRITGVTLEFQALIGGSYLKDGPLTRFQALIAKKPNLTWKELIADLLSAYEPANLADLNFIRLGELSQVSCPTLADFIDKFTRLESQLPFLPESFKISIFVKNLKVEIKEKLLSNVPDTLEKVIALANTLDVNLVLCKENTQNGFRGFNSLNQGNPQKPHNQEVYCKYHKSTNHSSADCRNKTVNQNNSSGKNNQNNNNNNSSNNNNKNNIQNSNTATNNSSNNTWCKFCKSKVCFKADCYKLQDLPKNKNVPNSKNVNFNVLESGNNSLNSFEFVKTDCRVPIALKQTLNVLNLKELDENVLNNLSLCHSKYLSPSDEGVILIDTGSILSKNIEIVFDSGCFKSVIPESFAKNAGLDCIPYRNCGFVANDVKIDIFGATINTPFKYKNTLTNMSFIILPRHNILLGMDWLALNDATINFGTRTIGFKDDPEIIHDIKKDVLKNDSNQLCLNTLDHANDELDNPIEESWSEYSNSLKIKPSFEEVETDLTNPSDIRKVKDFLTKNSDLFAASAGDLEEPCSILEYHIETTDEKPISFKPYGRSAFEDDLLDKDVEEMLKANIIEPSNSPYGFQGFYVRKIDPDHIKQAAKTLADKQKDRRLVLNFKPLNLVTIKDAFPPPVIKDIFSRLKHSKWYCCLDMTKGFWQIKLADDSKHKTAFRTRKGLFHFLRLPFGLVNASAMFSRVIYKVFEGLPFIESYIDDCVVHAVTIDLMFEYLGIVMERIRRHHLRINWKKCQWFQPLISAGEIFDNFKFCSVSKNSKILNYEHNCQLIIDNPVYKTKNFTILEKRSHMIDGEVYSCWAEIIWIRSWRRWFLFSNEERLTPERVLLTREQCWEIINLKSIFGQKLKCDNDSYCESHIEPIVTDYPHIGYTYFKGYHIISFITHVKKESLFKPIFDKSISSCLPKDFYCIAGENTYVWNETIIHNCEFFKVKTISLRGTEHVLFSNNSLVQISKSFSSCGIEIFATSQGLYLSENIIASNFSSETEDLNLEHHLMISDFDKKIFDLFGFITQIYITQRLNFCHNQIIHIKLLEEKFNEFGIIQDFNSKEIIVFNQKGDLIITSCVNITSISFNHSSEDCFYNIPVLGHITNITFKGFLFNSNIISNLIFKSDCSNTRIIKLKDNFKLTYSKGIIELSQSGREPLKLNLINQIVKDINFEHDSDVIMDLKEENQGKINDFFDRDFFIPPLIEHTNSSYANLEKFVTLVETIKWNPLTWDFFTELSHIFKVGLSIGVGLLITFIMGVLVYFSVKLTIYFCLKYKTYKAKHILSRVEREMELPFIQPRVDPEIINPNLMPLNLNETPVFASTVRRRSSMEFNTLVNGFENLKKNSIFNSQKFKNSILESK
jgi:hypothetical protein